MMSDDTEHCLLVAQALLTYPNNPLAFQRCLAWKLRFWVLGLPAGVGLATARSILKLWVGFPASRSGVKSAGNGPAMRSAILGVYFANDSMRRRAFVAASTRITHVDPRAETAAMAVAEAAAWAVNQDVSLMEWLSHLPNLGSDDEWKGLCQTLLGATASRISTADFANLLGQQTGVSGYSYRSIPVALFAFAKHEVHFRDGLEAVLNCGGDTDTTGAIVGALLGARLGREGIPADLISGILEWPRSVGVMEKIAVRLGQQLEDRRALGPVGYFWPGLLLRNALFLLVVLAHGFRRLAPPY